MLLFPNCLHQLLAPRESGVFEAAENIRTLKLVNLDHIAGHGGSGAQQALITAEVRDLLDRMGGSPASKGPASPRVRTEPSTAPPVGSAPGPGTMEMMMTDHPRRAPAWREGAGIEGPSVGKAPLGIVIMASPSDALTLSRR